MYHGPLGERPRVFTQKPAWTIDPVIRRSRGVRWRGTRLPGKEACGSHGAERRFGRASGPACRSRRLQGSQLLRSSDGRITRLFLTLTFELPPESEAALQSLYGDFIVGSGEFRRRTGTSRFHETVRRRGYRTDESLCGYVPGYVRIPYPGGDVPADTGVCTDEVIPPIVPWEWICRKKSTKT